MRKKPQKRCTVAIKWKELFSFVAATPIGQRIIGATLEELETNPQFQAFVEQYQRMNTRAASTGGVKKAECMICLFHQYGRERKLNTLPEPPRHRCSDKGGNWWP